MIVLYGTYFFILIRSEVPILIIKIVIQTCILAQVPSGSTASGVKAHGLIKKDDSYMSGYSVANLVKPAAVRAHTGIDL